METDPNGYVTRHVFDVFQRKIKTIRPYDSDALPTESFQYEIDGTPPERIAHSRREQSGASGSQDTFQFVDGLET